MSPSQPKTILCNLPDFQKLTYNSIVGMIDVNLVTIFLNLFI